MKKTAPATQRNRDPILEVLRRVLPASGTVLEVAAGTGEHALYFARALPHLTWQPSDADPAARASITAWAEEAGLPTLRPVLAIDASTPGWPVERADAILCINMVHISPWEATLGLMAEAGRLLPAGGPLVLYGPYRVGGGHTAASNEAFDQWLADLDPRYGVRDIGDLEDVAARHGLHLDDRIPMPANNFILVFRKGAEAPAYSRQ